MNYKYYKYLQIILLISTIFFNCNRDDNPSGNDVDIDSEKGVLILNEGLYGQNNSSLTYYDLKTEKVYQDVYSINNNNAKLGDTGNDIKLYGKKYFIVVDYSNKIEIVEKSSFKSQGLIDLGKASSPRELAVVDSETVYVTNALLDKVTKVNLREKKIISTINVEPKPEGILYLNGLVYVANSGFGMGSTISIIDISNDQVINNIKVGDNPRFLLTDSKYIYAICVGKYDAIGRGGIYTINPMTNLVIDSVIIDSNPQKSCLYKNNKILTINNTGVLLIDLTNKIIEKLLIDGKKINPSNGIVYSIAYSFVDDIIYCGNPKTFTQDGEIVLFNSNAEEIKRFPCGLNPGVIRITD